MDLLRARLQGPPARRLGPLLHRAVLPRRGDRARRRPPALLRMPAQGCARLSPSIGGRRSSCASGRARAEMDVVLHAERLDGRAKRLHRRRSTTCRTARSSRWTEGAFAVRGDRIAALDARATTPQAPAARATVDVLTPPAILAVLAGYDRAGIRAPIAVPAVIPGRRVPDPEPCADDRSSGAGLRVRAFAAPRNDVSALDRRLDRLDGPCLPSRP